MPATENYLDLKNKRSWLLKAKNMNKSRKARENSFRYQRVDLSREDSTDSEDDLDKILGPSTSPSMHNGVKYF